MEIAIQKESLGLEAMKDVNVKIYPNPTTDIVYIEPDTLYEGCVRLFDLNGKTYISKKIDSQIIKINIENIADGVYLISVIYKNVNHIEKIIKVSK